jgi:histidinol-phosphate phosphatase family protein
MIPSAPPGCSVAILAGGMGTRLKSRTGDLPKPMAPVCGKPVLEHLINMCRINGYDKIALLVHHRHEAISDYFGDGSNFGVALSYSIEDEPRGTAGALFDALPLMADRFLVLYGDTYADVDLRRMWAWHEQRHAEATLFLHPNDHPVDSDLVEIQGDEVVAIHPYPHEGKLHRNLVNAALYIFDKSAVAQGLPKVGRSDIAKNALPRLIEAGTAIKAYVSPEYIKDMGTPDRLDKVERHVTMGLAERLSGRRPRQAVFLDRDGTINLEVGHLKSPTQMELLPGAANAVRMLNQAGRLAVAVTNQPVLARGDVDSTGLDAIHAKMDDLLGRDGAYLDRLYYCPHHPDSGFPGEVRELKVACACRKPGTGMIDRAVEDLIIDRRESWMVGDTTSDIIAGQRSGLRTILVETGHGGRDSKHPATADYIMADLADAIDWILAGRTTIAHRLAPVICAHQNARLVLIGGQPRSGKSSAAQVLAELFQIIGRVVHVISLDGWIKMRSQREEGARVVDQFEISDLKAQLLGGPPANSLISVPDYRYDRLSETTSFDRTLQIRKEDVVIVEGVIGLLDPDLSAQACVTIQVDIGDDERIAREWKSHLRRGLTEAEVAARLSARDSHEVLQVAAAGTRADYRINGDRAS